MESFSTSAEKCDVEILYYFSKYLVLYIYISFSDEKQSDLLECPRPVEDAVVNNLELELTCGILSKHRCTVQ